MENFNQYNQGNNQNQGQNQYPYQYPYNSIYEPMSLSQWMVTLLLLVIPVVNIILLFVWGFSGDTNISKKNFARAQLIFMAIGFAIWLVIIILIASAGISAFNSYSY